MAEEEIVRIARQVSLVPLEHYISFLGDRAEDAAVRLLHETGSLDGLTEPQRRALVLVQKLDILNAVEFELSVAKGNVLAELEEKALAGMHPSDMYETVNDIARDFGMSKSEVADLTTLVNIIIPYLLRIGVDPREVWRRIGKAKMRIITPHLRYVIGGPVPRRSAKKVEEQVRKIQEQILDTYETMGKEPPDDMVKETVEFLLDAAENFTWADLTRIVQDPKGEETVPFYFDKVGKDKYQIEPIVYTSTQVELIRRRMGASGEVFIDDELDAIDVDGRVVG